MGCDKGIKQAFKAEKICRINKSLVQQGFKTKEYNLLETGF